MIQGTNVNEITESLPNKDIIRLIGNGWKPRSISLEIIRRKSGSSIIIDDRESLYQLHERLTDFLEIESKK